MNRYRIGVLLAFRSLDDRLLLIRRSKVPNRDLWCAIGGKLDHLDARIGSTQTDQVSDATVLEVDVVGKILVARLPGQHVTIRIHGPLVHVATRARGREAIVCLHGG